MMRIQQSTNSSTAFSNLFLMDKRRLDLHEQILLAKPPSPETLALIRSGNWREALNHVERISLRHRNMRHAQMDEVILLGADLRDTQLQNANLESAKLQGADLESAKLQGADLEFANLQGADLKYAELQVAQLWSVQLQGADLRSARLQSADLRSAQLQSVDLRSAELQGANLMLAQLQGASLSHAKLQGAELPGAMLQGANFRGASLYAADISDIKSELVDAREINWEPLDSETKATLTAELRAFIKNPSQLRNILNTLEKASKPGAPKPYIQSCLAESDTTLAYGKRYDPQKSKELADFTRQLHAYLADLACESPEIAWSIIKQIPEKEGTGSSREGLEVVLKKRLEVKNCTGLQGLRLEEKKKLRDLK